MLPIASAQSQCRNNSKLISLFCNQECDAITKISLEVPTPLLLESVDDGIVSKAVLVAVVSIATWW